METGRARAAVYRIDRPVEKSGFRARSASHARARSPLRPSLRGAAQICYSRAVSSDVSPSHAAQVAQSDDITRRIGNQGRRVHINTGAVCNNNCIFCMEEDRDARYVENSAVTSDVVREILDQNVGSEEICYTSGEPTMNPALPSWVAWARERGYHRISTMTNGRLLSRPDYALKLIGAGMTRFYVSIHGHNARLHEGLTRTPGSFAQTVRGLDVIALCKRRFPVDLHTSTVITRPQPALPGRDLRLPAPPRRRPGGVQRDAGQRPRRHLLRADLPALHRDRRQLPHLHRERAGDAGGPACDGLPGRHPALHHRGDPRLQPRLRRAAHALRRGGGDGASLRRRLPPFRSTG